MFVLLAFAIASCEKPSLESPNDIEIVPEAGYIRFSTGVATKAPMIENLRGKSFGVFGYKYGYSTRWDVARPKAKPEVFHNLVVNCAETNGACSYDLDSSTEELNLKPWELSKKYSFFSYYPLAGNTNGISVSGINDMNMPTVTYNLPLVANTSGEVNPDNLQDLMTAYAVDKTAYDGLVGFTFQHRLFCIEILAQNFNKDVIEVVDGVESVAKDADEVISDLTLTIDNLAYQSVTVPMMKGDSAPVTVPNTHGAVKFRIMDSSKSVTAPSQEGANAKTVSLSGDKYVMLIPQDASGTNAKLKGTLSFVTTDANGNTLSYSLSESEVETANLKHAPKFESDLNFEEGKKYTIVLSFTGKTVVIAIAEAGSWESHTVTYEFE